MTRALPLLLVLLLAGLAGGGEGFAPRLPDFTLADPNGREHTRAELLPLEGMRREFRDGVDPLVVVDERGALEVERGKTVVLVYDAAGKLLHDETGDPAMHRAARSWAALPKQ